MTVQFDVQAAIRLAEENAITPMERVASATVTNAVSSMAFSSGGKGRPPKIRTGKLAASLRWRKRGKGVRVGYGPEGWYARFLEPNHPTLLPALQLASKQVLA